MRLRTKILLAILGTLLLGDVAGTWIVQDRFSAGARREAANQAEARARQVQALIEQRAVTLEKQGETISLYPAVIQALVDHNPNPLRRWSGQVASLQNTSVTVTDAAGNVVARGHAPDRAGDNLAMDLDGLGLALAGQRISGIEAGDELGPAVRGYVPVLHDGLAGDIVGAVMIASPFDREFLERLAGPSARLVPAPASSDPPAAAELCAPPVETTATCSVPLLGPSGASIGLLVFEVPLADIEQAQAEAQRGLWLASAAVLVLGAAAAWLLARSLSQPLAGLIAAAERIQAGELHAPVDVRTSDEIGLLAGAFERMRARVADVTGSLRDERDVLDAVLESAADGILMVDEAGRRVVANRAWSHLAGEPSLAGPAPLQHVDDPATTFADAAARWLAHPEHIAGADFEQPEPYRRMRVYSAPVRHHGGAVIGRIFVLRDVTRETEAERMRAALIASVSHELRSPLTAITGYTATLLYDGPWDDVTHREFLEVVAQSAARLEALVDNLLDAATLDAGALRLQPEPVRVERLAEGVLAERRLLATGYTLRLESEPGLPLAHADPLRIEQVLGNLVDNAIKYSPSGGLIQVRLTAAEDGSLVVSVTDQGLGIPAAHLPHLFERFYRVDNPGRSIKGVGLGLYICRNLVESHGGRIWVESQPGRGSTFFFSLPTIREPSEDEAPVRELTAAGAGV